MAGLLEFVDWGIWTGRDGLVMSLADIICAIDACGVTGCVGGVGDATLLRFAQRHRDKMQI